MFVHQIEEELSLKLMEPTDAEELFELTDSSREHLRNWLPWLDRVTTVQHTREYIKSSVKSFSEEKGMNTAIMFKGKMVGVAGYNEIDHTNRIAYPGYWLHKDAQGQGIMTKVAAALTDYAFDTLELNRVQITVAEHNKKSRAIPERLGFLNEGTIRNAEWLYDHYVDHIVYGMLKHEWKQRS